MDLQIRVARQEYENAEARYETMRAISFAAIASACCSASASAWLLVRGITRQLGAEPAEAAALADSIARGDLTVPIALRPGDTGSLMAALAAHARQPAAAWWPTCARTPTAWPPPRRRSPRATST